MASLAHLMNPADPATNPFIAPIMDTAGAATNPHIAPATNPANRATNPSIPPMRGSPWARLPAELRIMIMKLACSRPDAMPVRMKFKAETVWTFDPTYQNPPLRHGIRYRSQTHQDTMPFRNHYISRLLVNRQWAQEALYVFFTSNTIWLRNMAPESLLYMDGSPADRMLGFSHLRSVQTSTWELSALAPFLKVHCPDLKHLHILAQNGSEIECAVSATSELPREHKHNAQCLERSAWLAAIRNSGLSGLESVTATVESERAKANLAVIQQVLTKALTRVLEPVPLPVWRAEPPGGLRKYLWWEKVDSNPQSAAGAAATAPPGPADDYEGGVESDVASGTFSDSEGIFSGAESSDDAAWSFFD